MVEVRTKSSDSWLDPRCNGIVGWKTGKRLWQRCQGRKGIFLTLTYKRDDYESPRHLWWKSQQEQHVALFLRKVARRLGVSLKGKWFCKLEFQTGGWVHWHILVLDVEHVPHAELTRMWSKGHVWVKRMTKKNVFYCCKYVSKNGAVPAWLLLERPRAVKVVRVSPGFWGEQTKKVVRDEDYERYGPKKPDRLNAYVPIAVKLGATKTAIVRIGNRVFDARRPLAEVVVDLLDAGAKPCGFKDGWLRYRLHPSKWNAANARPEDGRDPQSDRPEGRGLPRPPLHLSGTGNRDAIVFPPHIDAWFREEAEAEHEGGWASCN